MYPLNRKNSAKKNSYNCRRIYKKNERMFILTACNRAYTVGIKQKTTIGFDSLAKPLFYFAR